jgi:hypothetical protein
MDLKGMLKSKEYKSALIRISEWKRRLERGGKDEAEKVRGEKVAFISGLKKSRPDLYLAFQLDDKALSELIYKKMTGKDATLD